MTRFARSSLMLGVAVLSLAACSSSKGPGELGSKNDIVVRNNGLPQAKQAATAEAAPVKQEGGDFSSTVEQAEAIPMPEVATAEPLPDNSPAMEQAVKAQEEANAPLPSTAMDESTNSAIPADPATNPIDAVAPTTPVTAEAVTPPPADAMATQDAPAVIPPAPQSAPGAVEYPAAVDQAAQVPAPVAAPTSATPGPSAVPAGVKYPLDPNAAYSPKAVAEAAAAANVETSAAPATATSATAPMPTTTNINDPAVVRAAQAALKAKGAYRGEETGEVDAGFLNALILYQGQNNLPQGGLNEATLKQLGVFQ